MATIDMFGNEVPDQPEAPPPTAEPTAPTTTPPPTSQSAGSYPVVGIGDVQRAYQRFLGRPGSAEEWAPHQYNLNYWRDIGYSPESMAYRYAQIPLMYQQYLGRQPGENEYGYWRDPMVELIQGLQGSEEGQAYAAAQAKAAAAAAAAPPAAPTSPATSGYTPRPIQGFDWTKLQNQGYHSQKYDLARAMQSVNWGRGNLQPLIDYYNKTYGGQYGMASAVPGSDDTLRFGQQLIDLINSQGDAWQFLDVTNPGGGNPWDPTRPAAMAAPGTGTNFSGMSAFPGGGATQGVFPGAGATSGTFPGAAGQVFTDPATAQWEQILRGLVERMNQGYPNWTPAQLELQQTQALDPLERQRQAMRQQTMQRLSNRGITPTSGIAESALADVDRQFNELRAQTQGQFANQAIQHEEMVRQLNEQRAMQGLGLFGQIPQLADTRLQLARGGIQQLDPAQFMGQMLQFQAQQQQRQMQLLEMLQRGEISQQDYQLRLSQLQQQANMFQQELEYNMKYGKDTGSIAQNQSMWDMFGRVLQGLPNMFSRGGSGTQYNSPTG